VNRANFIAGEWCASASGETYEKRNPFDSHDVIGDFPASDARDVDRAVEAAAVAFPAWSRLSGQQRGAVLFRAADAIERRAEQIARDMTREMGKPLRESRIEAGRSADTLRFYAGEGWRSQGEIYSQALTGNPIYALRRPLGVVGLICPWNFPLSIPLWKSAPALAHGNAVVLKVAYEAPAVGLHLAACFEEAGLMAGAFNVIVGRGSEVGPALVRHPRVRALSFTGSVAVGHEVRDGATALGKRVQLELGGHSPLVVMADADLPRATEAAYAGAYWSAGQKCTATRRIYVQDQLYDSFRERLLARMAGAAVGDPADPATDIGPLVNASQMEAVLAAIERGQAQGGTLLAGGERIGGDGYLVTPALFENVGDGDYLSCEEVFGPVASLYRFGDLDEAIQRANASPFGLSASIFTRDPASVQRFVREVEAGIIRINAATAGGEPHVPFGGAKDSGYGPREQGRAALEFYTETVTVYQNP
jgi:acyl-CoA reductase-like NAD-dependent aldehyde dehydrogenase